MKFSHILLVILVFVQSFAFTSATEVEWNFNITPGMNKIHVHEKSVFPGHKKRNNAHRNICVYIPKKTNPPLVVSAHGNGGSALLEIKSMIPHLEKYQMMGITMDFESAIGFNKSKADAFKDIRADEKHLLFIITELRKRISWNKNLCLFTGYSGGGIPLWYIAMNHPDVFTALCPRSANFFGSKGINKISSWKTRPIYVFWGIKDDISILSRGYAGIGDGPAQLKFLRSHCENVKFEYALGGHASRVGKAIEWFNGAYSKAE